MAKSIFRNDLDGLGVYVPGKSSEMVMKEFGLTEIIKLASNENPLGPSKLAVEAIKNEAANVNIYPDPTASALKEKLGAKYGFKESEIIIGNGGEEILKMLAMATINRGDEAIMAEPTFSLYDISVSYMGGVSVKIPLKEDLSMNLDAMIEAITDKTKLMYICNPNNPIANIINKKELEEFVAKVPEHVVLVIDEAYYEYAIRNAEYPNGLEILKKRPNTLVMRTFAKVAGLAGMRIGYSFASEEIISEINKVRNVFNVNRLAQAAAVASMDDEKHIENTVNLNFESLGLFAEYFESKGMKYIESNANFIFVNIGMDSKIVFTELQKKGMILRPGFIWGYDTWVRISSGDIESTKKFIKALDEVVSA
jgi:histidinol-phosphate aminotransferase